VRGLATRRASHLARTRPRRKRESARGSKSNIRNPTADAGSRFKESRIRSVLFGNSRQLLLTRQNNRADLDRNALIRVPKILSINTSARALNAIH
jgi:hypothetical protein